MALRRSPTSAPPEPTRADALAALHEHASHGSAYLALNSATSRFSPEAGEGFVAYRRHGRRLFQFGDLVAPEDQREELLDAFLGFADRLGCRPCAVQLSARDAALYASRGFIVNQLGASFTVNLSDHTMRGTYFVKLRNKISRARRAGVAVDEVSGIPSQREPVLAEMRQLSSAWLRAKGRHVKELEFMVGQIGEADHAERRIFTARIDGLLIGFISYVPTFGERAGYLHDLSRRAPDAPPGVMELINATAIIAFQAEGAGWLTFGFTPFVQLRAAWDSYPRRSRLLGGIARFAADHLGAIYPAQSQEAYKLKWRPDVIEPEYLALSGKLGLVDVVGLLRMTRAV